MGNPLRDKNPSIYRLITVRTAECRLWLTPSANVRKLLGGILARYQEKSGVEIYAYFVLGNHLHLLVRAPNSNVNEFEANVNREISRRLNWKHHREGSLWEKRYSDLEVLSEEDLLEAFLYVSTNATKHGLVEDSREWEGLHSAEHCLKEQDRLFTFYHHSASREEDKTSRHRLKLSVLPQFIHLPKKERQARIQLLIEQRTRMLVEDRVKSGGRFMGMDAIRDQVAGEKPHNSAKSSRPACYTKCAERRRAFLAARRLLRRAYSEASMQFRLGKFDTKFPEFTFYPPLHWAPRLRAFEQISLGNQKKIV